MAVTAGFGVGVRVDAVVGVGVCAEIGVSVRPVQSSGAAVTVAFGGGFVCGLRLCLGCRASDGTVGAAPCASAMQLVTSCSV